MAGNQQFGRAASLLVYDKVGNAIELSKLSSHVDDTSEGLRFKFHIEANDIETPNVARIRIYNLSDSTMRHTLDEFQQVKLSAGYGDYSSEIFSGTIKQFRRGKERNVDSYLDISASDGDEPYLFAISNGSIPAGTTAAAQLKMHSEAMGLPLDPNAAFYMSDQNASNLRGKVFFGLTRTLMSDLADTHNVRWSIQNGVLTLIPLRGYLPGDIIEINSLTGMIGSPEATDQGIELTTLLNPYIRVGHAIRLNNADVTETIIKQQLFPSITSLAYTSKVNSAGPDGLYRVLSIEYSGDTRSEEWYSRLVCLLIDPSVPAAVSVSANP